MKRTSFRIFGAIAASVLVALLAREAELALSAALGLGLSVAAGFAAALGRSLREPLVELRDGVRALRDGRGEKRARPDASGELGALAAAVDRDVAELQRRLESAAEDKRQLEAVLAAMVEGVLVLDRDARIAMANPRFRELLGVWNEVEGRLPLEIVRNAEIDSALREAAAGDSVVVHEIEHAGPDERTLLMHAARVGSEGGRAGTVAVFHDVSEIRRLEQVRRDFIANASHELRTPLTSIRGYAETLLAAEDGNAPLHGPLQAVVRNAQRLSELVDDLLELSRIESRAGPIRPSEVDVAHICRQLAEDAGPRLRDAGVELELAASPDAQAWADPRAVEQVVGNLLENAIKYTEAGGRILLSAQRNERGIEIRVADSGVGIAPEEQARIFERFYRVDKARSRALGGTGLGLAIVKHLVQAMGGEIFVESEPGKGSSFRVILPPIARSSTSTP